MADKTQDEVEINCDLQLLINTLGILVKRTRGDVIITQQDLEDICGYRIRIFGNPVTEKMRFHLVAPMPEITPGIGFDLTKES